MARTRVYDRLHMRWLDVTETVGEGLLLVTSRYSLEEPTPEPEDGAVTEASGSPSLPGEVSPGVPPQAQSTDPRVQIPDSSTPVIPDAVPSTNVEVRQPTSPQGPDES